GLPEGGRSRRYRPGGACHLTAARAGIELGKRVRRIDETPAELVVAPLWSESLRARGEYFQHRVGIDRGMTLDQKSGDAADMGGRDRGPGRELILAVRCRHHDVDPW